MTPEGASRTLAEPPPTEEEKVDNFDRHVKSTQNKIGFVFVWAILMQTAIIGGIGFVIYKVLSHYGIM